MLFADAGTVFARLAGLTTVLCDAPLSGNADDTNAIWGHRP